MHLVCPATFSRSVATAVPSSITCSFDFWIRKQNCKLWKRRAATSQCFHRNALQRTFCRARKVSQGAPNGAVSLGEGRSVPHRRTHCHSASGDSVSRREVVVPFTETQCVAHRDATFLSARLASPFEAPPNWPCFPPDLGSLAMDRWQFGAKRRALQPDSCDKSSFCASPYMHKTSEKRGFSDVAVSQSSSQTGSKTSSITCNSR